MMTVAILALALVSGRPVFHAVILTVLLLPYGLIESDFHPIDASIHWRKSWPGT